MAETLGDAVLTLRTNDAQFAPGVTRAKGQAQQLGTTLDAASGSSAKLATAMATAGRSADQMGQSMQRTRQRGREMVVSTGQQRAGLQQLTLQLGDISTMYNLNAKASTIFATQLGQVTQAAQLALGGTSRFAAFMGGPWGIALSGALIVLAPFAAKLLETEEALEQAEFASDKFADAQGILGSILDLTTGKINTQSAALIALARAQLAAGRIGAISRRAEAQREMNEIRRGSIQLQGGLGGGIALRRQGNGTEDVVTQFERGDITASFAIGSLESRLNAGMIEETDFMRAAQAISAFGVEDANISVFEDARAALDGDQDALSGFLKPGKNSNSRSSSGRTQGEIDARFDSQLISATQQILRARQQVARNAEERAELQRRSIEWDRRAALADIQADTELSELQKAELSAAETRLADAELAAVEFARLAELEGDARALADQRYRVEQDALQLQLGLADTEAERKRIALQLLEAEEQYLRARELAVIFSETASDAERERAQLALQSIRATSGERRANVERANETTLERYLRDLQQTPEQINEALDAISIDGLDTLNDGLVDAITGAKSLGDVFSSLADQIIADLLRIAIQQAVIRPLAESLFGGSTGAGGGGLFGSLGSLFAGFFADGGTIPSGQFGIVGENGPEAVFATSGGVGVLPSSALREMPASGQGGGSITIPINVDATGADQAAVARLNARLDQLEQDLPGRIVTTIQDAGDRRIFTARGWR
ncbi:MAG: hypothetical protein AAF707_00065 [Pseudomonadota bacterium]